MMTLFPPRYTGGDKKRESIEYFHLSEMDFVAFLEKDFVANRKV